MRARIQFSCKSTVLDGSSPVTSTIGMRRRFIEICGASVIRYTLRAIPHNSKCRYGERGAAAAKPKAQIILCVLSSILATQMPCRTPSRSEALRSATAACGGSWRGDPPERCLSRKAGIMWCCLRLAAAKRYKSFRSFTALRSATHCFKALIILASSSGLAR